MKLQSCSCPAPAMNSSRGSGKQVPPSYLVPAPHHCFLTAQKEACSARTHLPPPPLPSPAESNCSGFVDLPIQPSWATTQSGSVKGGGTCLLLLPLFLAKSGQAPTPGLPLLGQQKTAGEVRQRGGEWERRVEQKSRSAAEDGGERGAKGGDKIVTFLRTWESPCCCFLCSESPPCSTGHCSCTHLHKILDLSMAAAQLEACSLNLLCNRTHGVGQRQLGMWEPQVLNCPFPTLWSCVGCEELPAPYLPLPCVSQELKQKVGGGGRRGIKLGLPVAGQLLQGLACSEPEIKEILPYAAPCPPPPTSASRNWRGALDPGPSLDPTLMPLTGWDMVVSWTQGLPHAQMSIGLCHGWALTWHSFNL